jgi:hypothetical protein
MQTICAWCNINLSKDEEAAHKDSPVSHGMCQKCAAKFMSELKFPVSQFLDKFFHPIVVVNHEGKIATANKSAQALLGKSLPGIMGFPGGD